MSSTPRTTRRSIKALVAAGLFGLVSTIAVLSTSGCTEPATPAQAVQGVPAKGHT